MRSINSKLMHRLGVVAFLGIGQTYASGFLFLESTHSLRCAVRTVLPRTVLPRTVLPRALPTAVRVASVSGVFSHAIPVQRRFYAASSEWKWRTLDELEAEVRIGLDGCAYEAELKELLKDKKGIEKRAKARG